MMRGIFAHRVDLDGLMSAAIYLRSFPDSEVSFVNYGRENIGRFTQTLNKAVGRLQEVVIADFGLDDENLDSVTSALNQVILSGIRVSWLDHHVWSEEALSRIKSVGVNLVKVPDREACGAQLVYRMFGRGDAYSGMLAEAAASTDFHMEVNDQIKALASAVDFYNNMFEPAECDTKLERLARNISKGILMDAQTYSDFLEYRRLLKEGTEKLLRSVSVHSVGSLTVAVGFREPPLGATVACDMIREKFPSDLQVVIKRREISVRRTNSAVNCAKIARALNGGGHDYAAGGELQFEVSDDQSREAAVKAVLDAVSRSV
ncbi:MAG: DHHA1 domain-containing protein [Thermoprotei archaeon]